jgi:hypothetical protein
MAGGLRSYRGPPSLRHPYVRHSERNRLTLFHPFRSCDLSRARHSERT